jgi:hypothetical protein
MNILSTKKMFAGHCLAGHMWPAGRMLPRTGLEVDIVLKFILKIIFLVILKLFELKQTKYE